MLCHSTVRSSLISSVTLEDGDAFPFPSPLPLPFNPSSSSSLAGTSPVFLHLG